ncbi:MAG: 30S ribosomal protein S2, partial [Methylobacteriaceae bacterium]|nr:30S ribosomal protein S2 [Methylobacteriaceae bacterium]
GIFHYWQIAAMTPADAERMDRELKLSGRIARDNWISQARALIAAA